MFDILNGSSIKNVTIYRELPECELNWILFKSDYNKWMINNTVHERNFECKYSEFMISIGKTQGKKMTWHLCVLCCEIQLEQQARGSSNESLYLALWKLDQSRSRERNTSLQTFTHSHTWFPSLSVWNTHTHTGTRARARTHAQSQRPSFVFRHVYKFWVRTHK